MKCLTSGLLLLAISARIVAAQPMFGNFAITACQGASTSTIGGNNPTIYTTNPTWNVTVTAASPALMGTTEAPTVIAGTQALWHMNETSGPALDATSGGRTLSDASSAPIASGACAGGTFTAAAVTYGVAGEFSNAESYGASCAGGNYNFAKASTSGLGSVFLGAFSVEAWIKSPAAPEDRTGYGEAPILINCSSNAPDQCMLLGVKAGKLYMDFDTFATTGATTISAGWHHVAFVYDGVATQSVYLDGNLDASASASPLTAVNAATLVGGGLSTWPPTSGNANDGNAFGGSIDELRVLNYALGAAAVASHAMGQGYSSTANYLPDQTANGSASFTFSNSNASLGALSTLQSNPLNLFAEDTAENLATDGITVAVNQTSMAAPSMLASSVTVVGGSSIAWNWGANFVCNSPNTTYQIQLISNGAAGSFGASQAPAISTQTSLVPNTAYGLSVKATYHDVGGSGQLVGPSPASLPVFATTYANVPGFTSNVFTSGSSTNLTINGNGNPSGGLYNGNPSNVTQYQIYASRNGGAYGLLQTGGAGQTLSLQTSSSYAFEVAAVNANGAATTLSAPSAAYITQPSIPGGFSGTADTNPGFCPKSDILWTWNQVTAASTGASALYNLTTATTSPLLAAGVNSFVQTGLSPFTLYKATVTAYDPGGGNGAFPNSGAAAASATTLSAAIPAPTGVGGTPQSTASIQWSWTASPLCSGGVYDVINANTGATLLANTPASPFTQTGLGVNAIAAIVVKASDSVSNQWSPLSASASAYTMAAVPTGLTAASISTGGFVASWNANGNPGYTRYELTYTADPAFLVGISTRVGLVSNFTGTSIGVTGLQSGVTEYVRVRAFNGQNSDSYGGIGSAFDTYGVVTVPPAPSLSGAPVSNSAIQWTWTSVTGATGYTLYDAPTQTVLYGPDAPSLSFTSSTLSANTNYSAQVEADEPSPAPPSARGQASAYTLANPPGAPSVSAIYSTSATFSWNANGNPAYTFYQVVIATDAAYGFVTSTLTVSAPMATATGLLPGVTYYSRVQAVNGGQIPTAFVPIPVTVTAVNQAITVSSGPPSPYDEAAGLVGAWQFDEDTGTYTADGSGNGDNGNFACLTAACVSTPTWAASLPGLGTAASFSGHAGGVVLTTNGTPFNFTGSVTVEAWVNPLTSVQTAGTGIVARGAQGAEDFALDVSASGSFRFLISNGVTDYPVTVATATMAAGQWTHVVGVYDAAHATATLYLNGVPAAAASGLPGARSNSGSVLSIGNRMNSGGLYTLPFSGRIDSVRVFDIALTAPQVLSDYRSAFVSSVTPPSPNNGIIVAVPPNAFCTAPFVSCAPAQIFISADPVNHPIRITPAALSAGLAVTPAGMTLVPDSLVEVVPVVNGIPFTGLLGSSATVTIPYPDPSDSGIVSGTNPPLAAAGIRMYTLNTAVNAWTPLPTTVLRSAQNANGLTPHFSVFGLFAPQTIGSSLAGVRVYPVPWKPGSGGRFDAPGVSFADVPASGTIRILTLAGLRVRDFGFNGASAGVAVWDGANDYGQRAASGVYFARITSGVDGSTTLVKFAIER